MNRAHLRGGALTLGALLVAGLGLLALPVALQAQGPALAGGIEVAQATVHAGGVDFQPSVRHAGGVVTVSGGGLIFQQKIAPGRSHTISPFDPEGRLLPDGVYTWSLELLPDAATAASLREAAAENGGRAPGAWKAQTGSFTVRNGLIASADLVEAVPERAAGPSAALPQAMTAPAAAAVDVDSAVGGRQGVEAAMAASVAASAPAAAPVGLVQADRTAPERSDAGATAMGRSLEAELAPAAAALSSASVEERPTRNYLIDDPANGRPDSRNKR